jgi:hypothetical protein
MLLACTECTLYLEKREDEREYLDFTREKKLFEIIQKICLEVVDDDFDTFNDEHNERGQNAQNKHDDRDRKDGGTLVVERALRESICFFVCAWKECGFCSICVCFSRSVTSVCVVENLREKCLSLFLSV